MTIRTRRRTTLLGALTAPALALALTACGGSSDSGSDSGKPSAQTSGSGETAEPKVASFPVGKPFGDAVWTARISTPSMGSVIKSRGAPVAVRADRVLVEYQKFNTRAVQAFSDTGEKVWTHKLSEHAQVLFLDKTVAVLEKGESKASGLDKPGQVTKVTLLSQADGSAVSETEIPDTVATNGFATLAYYEGESVRVLSEAGKPLEAPGVSATKDVGLIGEIPFWRDEDRNVTTASWSAGKDLGIDTSDLIESEVQAIDNKQGLMLLSVTSGPRAERTFYGVKADTGKAFEIDCPNARETDSFTDVTTNSPNGQYGVIDSVVLSGTEGRCLGGGEQKDVKLTAVDDNGTAYGTAEENELAVITADGKAEVSQLPGGASAPIGVMKGDIAVHWNQSAGILSGNPIK
ncbi:hypothetical protein [Streptomyces sp. NPDC058045]|uniref:hypothetical protein n=1 Tax=Streptomyces sp. NPDC058045 TaxID=3346311 RepID=UPI0036E0510F